jgi:hypothetical protein
MQQIKYQYQNWDNLIGDEKDYSHYRGPILVETLEMAAQQMYLKFLFWTELRRT